MNNENGFSEYDIYLGGNAKSQVLISPKMACRHGLIAGATGTGKTVSLQVLAEQFSQIGVPVFLADVKGDLSGLAEAGLLNEKIKSRLTSIGFEQFNPRKRPVLFWDMFNQLGHPVRTSISDIGPLLLSNLLSLNETQSGVLYSCFDYADDNGLLLLDLKDLRSMLSWMGQNRKEIANDYGNISTASLGSIQRKLLVLEEQGAEHFFGEPGLNLNDLMITDFNGQGVISIMDVSSLMSKSPKLYATFLLWLLAELYEQLPEVGDIDKPKLVLFFDEAHLLFDQAPKALIDKMEQVVRLIRSKGVGIYFISQNPLDIPDEVLGQLGTRIQHALRAFTARDQKAVKAAAETFRPNPLINSEIAITQLGTGEALVSVLDEKGIPTPVEKILIRPPESRIGPLSLQERKLIIDRSPLSGRYDRIIDRESAYEILKEKALQSEKQVEAAKIKAEQDSQKEKYRSNRSSRQSIGETILKSAARSIGSSLGRKIMRGLLGSLLGGR